MAINSVVSGGVGASIASVIVAVVQTVSKKGESRANAADLIASAAGDLTERINTLNEQLERDNRHMRAALLSIIDCLDELITSHAVPADMADQLRSARREANEAI